MRAVAAFWCGVLLWTVAACVAGVEPDPEYGRVLHDAGCLKCHNQEIYTRPNHVVQSYAELRQRVEHCAQGAGMTWFDEEMDDVAAYLNQNFYHFPIEGTP